MNVHCPHCETWSVAPNEYVGRQIKCQHCGQAFKATPVDPPAQEKADREFQEQTIKLLKKIEGHLHNLVFVVVIIPLVFLLLGFLSVVFKVFSPH